MQTDIQYITKFPEPVNFDNSEERWNKKYKDSFVIINCLEKKIYYPDHWTPFSVKCAFKGKEYYCFNNKTYLVNENAFLILNRNNIYSSFIKRESDVESFSLNYSDKSLEEMQGICNTQGERLLDMPFEITSYMPVFIDKLYEYSPGFLSYVNQFRKELSQQEPNMNILHELMYQSLEELWKLNFKTSSEIDTIVAKKRSTREELYKRLSLAKDYMYSCFQDEVTLDNLGSICYLHPAYLLREFKKLFGITPHQYLTKIRLQQAHYLITNTNKSVSDILRETGFVDISSFSKLYKKNFRLSPKLYRLRFSVS